MLKLSKKNLTIIVLIILLIVVSVCIVLKESNSSKTFTSNAKVVEKVNFNHVIIELDKKNNSNSQKMDIYSNIFETGDKMKVEYTKKNGKYAISKIISLSETQLEKSRLVKNIKNDVTMLEYKSKISGYSDISKNQYMDEKKILISDFYVLPIKISNQYYETLSSNDFYEIKNYLTDTEEIYLEKNSNVTLEINSEFKILSLKNVFENKKVVVEFKQEDDKIIFQAVGQGIYEAQVEFKNGDIINYLFT